MDTSPSGARRGKKRRNRSNSAPSNGANSNAAGDHRRRKKRRRPGQRQGDGAGGRGRQRHASLEPVRDGHSVLGQREVVQKRNEREQEQGPPDAFALFCAYHLGVTVDDGYQKPSLDGTARRYGMSADELKGLLTEHSLDPDSIEGSDFDLEGAKMDVRLAPEGISRTEIAREHFEEFQAGVNQD